MNILYVYADSEIEWNCSEWRCAVPARAIQQTGLHTAALLSIEQFSALSSSAEQACGAADVIVIQRNLFGPTLSAILHWKARGKLVVADFDDAYQVMPPAVVNYPFWVEGKVQGKDASGRERSEIIDPPPLAQFKWGLRMVHAATTPSRQLAADWQSYTGMHYLPNFIDLGRYQQRSAPPHRGTIIGWGGSLSHLQSFTRSGVGLALKRVCRARPGVKVMVCGDRRVYEQMPLPAAQKVFQPFVAVQKWPDVLAGFDIGLAPLDGAYDDRRSWIKVLEYMAMQIPWLASRSPAYDELAAFGSLVENSPAAWEAALLDVIDHLDERRAAAAGAPYAFACAQDAAANAGQIVETYRQIAQAVQLPL